MIISIRGYFRLTSIVRNDLNYLFELEANLIIEKSCKVALFMTKNYSFVSFLIMHSLLGYPTDIGAVYKNGCNQGNS